MLNVMNTFEQLNWGKKTIKVLTFLGNGYTINKDPCNFKLSLSPLIIKFLDHNMPLNISI
jgi:hypothetical protein